jgi:hypothetical protein
MEVSTDRDLTSSPTAVEHATAVAITLLVLESHSRLPEAGLFVSLVSAAAILSLGFGYLWRVIHIAIRRIRATFDRHSVSANSQPIQSSAGNSDVSNSLPGVADKKRFSFLNWLVLPACLLVIYTSTATHWPAVIRFYFSRASFEELVAQSYSGKMLKGFPRRVGLYWIEDVEYSGRDETTGRRRIGFITGVALLDPCGLEYDEMNPPDSHYLTTQIAPCWYLTEW